MNRAIFAFFLFSGSLVLAGAFDNFMEELFQVEEGFPMLAVPGCSQWVGKCLTHLDTHGKMCTEQWRQQLGSKFDTCNQREIIRQYKQEWVEASREWRQSLIACLSGPRPRSSGKIKRNSVSPPPTDSNGWGFLDSDHSSHQHDAVQCWLDLAEHTLKCTKEYAKCSRYAICIGNGTEPVENGSKTWFKRNMGLSKTSREKGSVYFERLGLCLEELAEISTDREDNPTTQGHPPHHHHDHHHHH